ncbi:MAG: hypothetical protein WCU88_10655 [Elusimicrobiota bacterium]|jgi:hypothetical protein
MKTGNWLMPRYTDRTIFEKDFPKIDMNGLDVYCPGCKTVVRLGRKNPAGKVGGWCARCIRSVAP